MATASGFWHHQKWAPGERQNPQSRSVSLGRERAPKTLTSFPSPKTFSRPRKIRRTRTQPKISLPNLPMIRSPWLYQLHSSSSSFSTAFSQPMESSCPPSSWKGTKDLKQDPSSLSKHLKATFGASWKQVLHDGKLLEGNVTEGSPAVLVISSSALRSLELLRGLRSLTRECRAVKLFAKHMKVEEQVALLKSRVNIACGTPSRIKKLIDIDALGLSRLALVVLDMHTDAKGYSLFTLPQVRDEFWDLFKSHFHQQLLKGDLRLCFYGSFAGIDLKNIIPSDK